MERFKLFDAVTVRQNFYEDKIGIVVGYQVHRLNNNVTEYYTVEFVEPGNDIRMRDVFEDGDLDLATDKNYYRDV